MPSSLYRLLLGLALLVILVVLIVVIVQAASTSNETADYQRYMTTIADLLKRSDTIGAELEDLLTNPGDTSRSEIQSKLESLAAASERLQVEATKVEAPEELVERGVHEFFLLVMVFRQEGMDELKPALLNALEVEDTEVASEQISHALRYLSSADFLYQEVFVPKARAVLTEKELAGVTVPASKFLSDPDIASTGQVLDLLAGLKSSGSLQAVHGVAVKKIVALPDDKEITAGGTFNLTSTADLAFAITVENQGNMDESDIPVEVTLLTSESSEPQKITKTIPQLKAKAQTVVTVKGIDPAPYGEVALLRVKVGPVPNEKYMKNNVVEANVIFKL